MKKIYVLLFGALLLSSCNDGAIEMGDVHYYPSFLWCDAKMDTLTKIYDFDFNADAKADPSRYAEFKFVDNNGELISQDEIIVYVDGAKTRDNTFIVKSNESNKELKFAFTPEANSGTHQGYLQLIDHNLNRINNTQLSDNKPVDVFQWTIKYKTDWNPLKKLLMWIGIVILALLVLWFMVIRPAMYTHFRAMVKSVIISKDGRIIKSLKVKFTGARSVVFYNKREKQSILERLFIGRREMLIDEIFVDKLRFSPRKIGGIGIGADYNVKPNPFPRNGIVTINYTKQNIKIELK